MSVMSCSSKSCKWSRARLLIFGLHVHVGIADPERRIHIMNAARYFLPHVLALTTSSPFWLGHNTGLKSYRSEVFKKFPRTDIPDHFDSLQLFRALRRSADQDNCIDNGKKIWWDVRPHPFFPTLEFRICDIPTRVDDTIAIAALFQAIVAKLNKLIDKNLGFRLYSRALIQENKWRAVRYGLDGKMIDFGKQKEVPVRDLILELLEFVDDVVDDLDSRKEIEHIHTILERGTSADEQLQDLPRDQRSQSRRGSPDRTNDGERSARRPIGGGNAFHVLYDHL